MMVDDQEMIRIRDEAKAQIADPQWELKQTKGALKIVNYRIKKHEVLLNKIERGKWKDEAVEKARLEALANNDIKILNDLKNDFKSTISKLEKLIGSKI